MNRALPKQDHGSPLRALSLGPVLPRAMRGAQPALALQSVGDFQIRNAEAAKTFEQLYSETHDPALQAAGRETFEAIAMLQTVQKQPYQPAAGAAYPGGKFGDSLRQIAQLIKADVGVELAFADVGGWDHHVNEPGQMANLLRDYGQALNAFWTDMGDRMEDVVLVTMSEFGRTARENGNRGTDHGHANCMFLMGGMIAGGKVHGQWPGLQREQLYENRDLALTSDFRDVLGELVARHLGNSNLKNVFPGYDAKFLGVVASA